MIVLIDDERNFKPQWIVPSIVTIKTSSAALDFFQNFPKTAEIAQVWFDHDLGLANGEPDTSIIVSKMFENSYNSGTPFNVMQFVVHTSNPVGGKQLMSTLSKIAPTVRVYAGDFLEVK